MRTGRAIPETKGIPGTAATPDKHNPNPVPTGDGFGVLVYLQSEKQNLLFLWTFRELYKSNWRRGNRKQNIW